MGFYITRLLGKSLHTLIKSVSFSSPTNIGYHRLGLGSYLLLCIHDEHDLIIDIKK